MSDLANRIRASREEWITAGGYEFNVRRPTALQLSRWAALSDTATALLQCVVDWKVAEKDVIPGGGGKVPPFDSDAFREWAEDRPELLGELSTKIKEIIHRYVETRESAEKNS